MYTKENLIELIRAIKPAVPEELEPYIIDKITFNAPKKFKDTVNQAQCRYCLNYSLMPLHWPVKIKDQFSDFIKNNPPKKCNDSSVTYCMTCKKQFTDIERMFKSSQSKIRFILNNFIWISNFDFLKRKKEPLVLSLNRWDLPFRNYLLWEVSEQVLTKELDDLNLTQYLPIIENSLLYYFSTQHPNLLKHE